MDKETLKAAIEKANFFEKHLQPELQIITENIIKLRKRMSKAKEGIPAQALEYLLSDINWYWNEADLWEDSKNDKEEYYYPEL